MKKIIIEIDPEIKKNFLAKCAKQEKTQKAVLTRLICKWLKK